MIAETTDNNNAWERIPKTIILPIDTKKVHRFPLDQKRKPNSSIFGERTQAIAIPTNEKSNP